MRETGSCSKLPQQGEPEWRKGPEEKKCAHQAGPGTGPTSKGSGRRRHGRKTHYNTQWRPGAHAIRAGLIHAQIRACGPPPFDPVPAILMLPVCVFYNII